MGAGARPDRWCGVRSHCPSGDDGTSLLELMVGMLIMVIFMGMFTGAVVLMNRAENKAEAVTVTSSQLNQAFLTLDKTVRYAAAISVPATGTTSGDWYVELRTTNTSSEVCTQLRVDITVQGIQGRTWTVTGSVASTPTAWAQVAANITNGGAAGGSSDQPFVLKARTATVDFQQLTINLVSGSGSGGTATTSRSSFTFSALNSTSPPPTAPICQEAGRP